MQQPVQQNYQSAMVQPPILVWVTNEDDAIKFPLNINQSIFMMNQNEPYLYMKSVDQLGKTTFIKKRLIDESEKEDDTKSFIKRDEIDQIISDKIQKEIEKRMAEISFKPTKRKTSDDD